MQNETNTTYYRVNSLLKLEKQKKKRVAMPTVKQSVKRDFEQEALEPKKPQKSLKLAWRERIGVEPTVDTAGCPPTDLKSAESTGAHPLPIVIKALPGLQAAQYASAAGGQSKLTERLYRRAKQQE